MAEETTERDDELTPEELAEAGSAEDTGEDEEDSGIDLSLLSPDERAAFEASDDEDGEADASAEESPGNGAKVEEPAATEAVAPPVDMAAVQAALDSAKAAKSAAFDAYEDGELTRSEYLAKLEEIDAQSGEAAALKAEADRQAKASAEAYEEAKKQFTATAREYLTAVPELATAAHVETFDRFVRMVTADGRNASLSHRQMLEKAHRLYIADGGDGKAAIPAVPSTGKATATERNGLAPKPAAPKTLARVPAAAMSAAQDGKYGQLQAQIDKAGPQEIEEIMRSLSPDEREAFASMDL